MLYFFSGTDRQKARAAMQVQIERIAKSGADIVRISDANTVDDLKTSLMGGGMFGGARVVVLEGVLDNEEMREIFFEELVTIKASSDAFFLFQEKVDAATRRQIEKYAETSEKFDAPKKGEGGTTIFALANALRRADKKALWVGYQQELADDVAPEAIHGVLFWGAKDMLLKATNESERVRAKGLVARLTELPHEARRNGEDLEYALERFVLSKL